MLSISESLSLRMRLRYYLLALSTFILGFLLALEYRGSLAFPSSSVPLTDALTGVAVIIDLGILLLIVYEDLLNPIFLGRSP